MIMMVDILYTLDLFGLCNSLFGFEYGCMCLFVSLIVLFCCALVCLWLRCLYAFINLTTVTLLAVVLTLLSGIWDGMGWDGKAKFCKIMCIQTGY